MSKYRGKKVLVVGLGKSGVASARYLSKQGARVLVTDQKQKSELGEYVAALADPKIELELGRHNSKSFTSAELIVMSPGVPPTLKPLDEARAAGVPITNEIDLAGQVIRRPIIGITGTNGKTTVTTLVGEMFKADGKSAFVGGNIGKPLLDYVNDGQNEDFVVAELSSFQLELAEKLVPSVAVWLNIEPDHMDRYADFESYANAKRRLLKLCDNKSTIVLNYDDPNVARAAPEGHSGVVWFTKRDPMSVGGAFAEKFSGAYYRAATKEIVLKLGAREEIYPTAQAKVLGDHNRENFMAAIIAARSLGVSAKAIQSVVQGFRGLPHRLEFVRRKDGVYFFNDSKGTNVMSLRKSLQAFPSNPVILIAGGKDKGGDFTPLVDLVRQRVKILILAGEAKEKINRTVGDFTETFLVGTFEEAVLLAYQKSRAGDVVLLSPGCSSFDMFRNFEERGDYFKKLVNQL